jgi:putative flippase GtrA
MIKRILRNEAYVRFLKFLVVGVLNTTLSLAVIWVLMALGVSYKWANVVGYVAGLINSFVWNKQWVFRSNNNLFYEMAGFGACFVVCYGVQFLLLSVMVEHLEWNEYLAQLLAMGAYTVLNFILNRLFTFRRRESEPLASDEAAE